MRGDGSSLFLSISAVPLLDEAGQVRLVIGSLADITAQRSLQDQLRQSQKMEIFGQLAGGIAHDFNNILTAMGISLYLLERKVGFSPEAANFINDLRSMTKRAGGLTEQLLLFARRRVVQMEKIDLNVCLKGLIKILAPALGERISLVMEPTPAPVWIEGDASMIDQIVMNLCVNARDAIATAGVIKVATGTGEVHDPAKVECRLGTARVGSHGFIRVSDTGMGMTPQVLARIFEPFFTTKDTGKGTGLGLATVHGIVEQHHGWATVESFVGHGTVFSVYFPLADCPSGRPELRAPSVKGLGETILFVEDEASVRKLCTLLLQKTGYRVLEASNASEALALWSRHSADVRLLVTDMVMPGGMSGLDLISRARQDRVTLSAILTSGYNDEILKADQLTGLGIDLLPKPYDIDSLTQLISEKLKLLTLPPN
jgi:signal transduction histidine kinase/CheY-like chemotaxis protein